MRYCPECRTDLDADDTVYVMNGVIAGCRHCIQQMEADEYFEGREITEQEYMENALWELAEERRYGLDRL